MKNKRFIKEQFKRFKTKLSKSILLNLILVFSAITSMAQVTGTVTFTDGKPIPGASVVQKGTTNGTTTDIDGKYQINVPENSVLIFSFVGMKYQEINVETQKLINVTLEEEIIDLDEVVVIGYGTIKKSDMTGAVSVVKAEAFEKLSASTAAEGLQGRVSGLSITSKGAAPGSNMDIKIRGIGSFGGNSPLIIVDGVPVSQIDYLNPNDIASVNVLKDAASAAIYGSRAGNGVILIETKQGKKGDAKISFSSTYGIENVSNIIDMANADEYRKINTLVNQNGITEGTVTSGMPVWLDEATYPRTTGDTDWQDELFRTGVKSNYNLSIRGGSDNVTYAASGSMFDHDGIVIGSSYQKYNARLRTDITSGKLKVSPNISYSENRYDLNDYDPAYHGQSNSFVEMRKMSPLVPVYDEDRPNGYGYLEELRGENPVAKENLKTHKKKVKELVTNLNLEYEVFEGLKIKLQSGLRNYFFHELQHHPSYQIDVIPSEYPELTEYNYSSTTTNIEPMISYEKEISNHNFNLVLGTTYNNYENRDAGVYVLGENPDPSTTERAGFMDDENFQTLNAAGGGTFSGYGTEQKVTQFSYFGRLNYAYHSKYLLQVTLRQDYSSRFGKDVGGGLFPSVALGWNIHKEQFMKPLTDIITNLKLRASYGQTGSQANLGPYDYATLITTTGLGYPTGTSQVLRETRYPSSLENRMLQWENTESINMGLDFGIFNSQLIGEINYFSNTRTNMLLQKPVPPSAGISAPWVNIGEMKNYGWEFELSYRKKIGDLFVNAIGSLTIQNNEVLKLSYQDEVVWGSSIDYNESVTRTKDGDPVSSFYLYQADGIFQTQEEADAYNSNEAFPGALLPNAKAGDIRFVDINGDGILDDDDRIYSGNGLPKYLYSFDISAEYKGIDLSLFFQGAADYKIYNTTKYYNEHMKDNFNYSADMVNAWTDENPSETIPRPVFGDPNGNSRSSTRFLEDGDYLRLKTIQLGYSLPKNLLDKIKVDKCRIYVSAQNLFTITDYTGYDPELVERSNVWNTGIDYGEYPLTKIYNIGIQLDF